MAISDSRVEHVAAIEDAAGVPRQRNEFWDMAIQAKENRYERGNFWAARTTDLMESMILPDVEEYLLADWETIAREHGPMAFSTAWRILGHVQDSEDVVQEALLDALRIFRARQVSNWGGLLRHLATCRALDRLRGRPPSQPLVGETMSPVASQPENVAIERELARRLRTAVVELPDRQARVFSLRYFGEMSNSEIAETLQIRVDAVAVALHKARAKLKRLLDVEATPPARKKA